MHTLLSTTCLASVIEEIPFGILVPITLFLVALGIVVAVLHFKNQNRKLWHETARIALEKGQPIPPSIEIISTNKSGSTSLQRDVKAGLILLAVTAGMYFNKDGPHVPETGFYIPGFIGLALLLNALFTHLTKKNAKAENPNSQPPKA